MALPHEPSPIAQALQWVSRVLAVAAVMVLPGVAGQWLDERWGTGFLALLGLALGVTAGIWSLLAMTRPPGPNSGVGKGREK